MADWSHLQPDLLLSISETLTLFSDYIRLRSVCRHFFSTLPSTPRHLPPQPPWLILPPTTTTSGHRRGFFDFSNRKLHLLDLPPVRVFCSSLGWLLIETLEEEDEGIGILCINPLTRIEVRLPLVSNLPDFDQHSTRPGRFFFKKVVFSSSPANGDGFVAVGIVNYSGDLAYCVGRDGNVDCWKMVYEGPDSYFCFEDLIYWNGLFYGLNRLGSVAVIDVGNDEVKIELIETPDIYGAGDDEMLYLVSLEDDLLMVIRGTGDPYVPWTSRFEVWKLDRNGRKWDEVKEIGKDYLLFLGRNKSMSFKASDFGGCKGNCIYFTGDDPQYSTDDVWMVHDMGIYDVGNSTVEPFLYLPEIDNSEHTPMWITPNPC